MTTPSQKTKQMQQQAAKQQVKTVTEDIVISKELAIAFANTFNVTTKALANSQVISAADASGTIEIHKALFDQIYNKYAPKPAEGEKVA